MDALKQVFGNLGEALKAPVQQDIPLWKILAVALVVGGLAYWVFDQTNLIRDL